MTKRELEAMVLSLQAENVRLMEWATAEIAKRDAIIERQAARIAELEETVAALAAQIRSNSSNSSKPPSSDGLKKPAPKSLRKNTGKKPGGQAGHRGHGLKLKAEIDHVAPCLPLQCASCPQRNECAFRVRDRRNVLDIVIRLERTEYQQMETVCPLSGRRIAGDFPEGIAGTKQYGPSLKALAAILVMECAVGLEKTSQVIRGLTGCSLRKSSILNHLRACAAKLEAPMDYLREQILGSPVVNFDETGIRAGGKLQYLHTASTASTTCLTASSFRGKRGMDEGQVLPRYRGIAVHDCWLSYWKYEGISAHGVCCAHLLRECKGLHEMHPDKFFFRLFPALLMGMQEAKERRIRNGKEDAGAYYMRKYMAVYDNLISVGRIEHPPIGAADGKRGRKARGKANAFVERMARLKDSVCLFFRSFDVPFDNNQAERDLRPSKVKLKVSGCFRTEEGASLFATFISFISTAKKRGRTAWEALNLLFAGTPMLALSTAGD